jgi:hypothetical protein
MANIIFIHKGWSNYLYYSLSQSRAYNPDVNIYLIGDRKTNKFNRIVEHVDYKNHSKSANEFKRYYKHLSSQPYSLELFCFQRWFIINEFVREKNISKWFAVDSDVMIFCEVEKEMKKFSDYDLMLISEKSAGHSIWTKDILDEFCCFLMSAYRDKNKNYERMVDHYQYLQDRGMKGGVCDMTAIGLFVQEVKKNKKIGFLTDIVDGSAYDSMLSQSQDKYVMENEIKK